MVPSDKHTCTGQGQRLPTWSTAPTPSRPESETGRPAVRAQVAGSAFQELAEADPELVLYRRGERSGTFTLILQGRVLIHTGTYEPAVLPDFLRRTSV